MKLSRLIAWQPFTPLVFLSALAIALLVVALIVFNVVNGARENARNRVDAEMGSARAKASQAASKTIDRSHDFQSASEALSRDSENAIRNAPGAGQRLDPSLNDVGRRRMCERSSLRGTPDCVLILGPEKPSR